MTRTEQERSHDGTALDGSDVRTGRSDEHRGGPLRHPLLIDAVEALIAEFCPPLVIGRVTGAVARAKHHVRNGFAVLNLELPPPDELVSLVIGLARQELAAIDGPMDRRGRPIGI